MLCLELDANAKVGNQVIKNDPHEMSSNGRLLLSLVERYNLIIVNATDKCFGTITRMKKVKNVTEKSIIDYFIVCQNFYSLITSMIVDDERKNVLTKFTKRKEKSYITESDHNLLILDVNISWNMKVNIERTEIFNLRNIECQKSFFEFTNNSDRLTNSLINTDIRKGGRLWLKNLKFCILQNFKKIRLNSKKKIENNEIGALLEKRKSADIQSRNSIDDSIANKIFERNRKIIIEQVGGMVDTACNLSRIKMWKIKQKVCPKTDVAYPVAKMNNDGVLVSNKSDLKSLYVNTYKERLKHRTIRPGYEKLKQLKDGLFSLRLKLSKLINLIIGLVQNC